MAAICKPEDAVVTKLVSTQTFTDTNGYYTQNQISLFQNEYVNALNAGVQNDPLTYMTDKYGSDAFFTTVGNINEYTAKPYIQALLLETPDLNPTLIGELSTPNFLGIARGKIITLFKGTVKENERRYRLKPKHFKC